LLAKLEISPAMNITTRLIKLFEHLFENQVPNFMGRVFNEKLDQVLATNFLDLLISFFQ